MAAVWAKEKTETLSYLARKEIKPNRTLVIETGSLSRSTLIDTGTGPT